MTPFILQTDYTFESFVYTHPHASRKQMDGRRQFDVIVDLGSPLTLMPKSVWRAMENVEILSAPIALGGIGKGVVMARLAKIELAFLSTRKEIVEMPLKAYLAEDDSAPPLLGVEDFLTNVRLSCDYPKGKAFLHIAE